MYSSVASCSSGVLRASEELPADCELFSSAVEEFVDEPPARDELQLVFDLLSEYEFWPTENAPDPEAVTFMGEVGVSAGVLDEAPNPEEFIDRRALDPALEMIAE